MVVGAWMKGLKEVSAKGIRKLLGVMEMFIIVIASVYIYQNLLNHAF